MFRTKKGFSLGTASAVAIAASLLAAGAASAQGASSTLRGQVTDEGAAEAGAVVVATDVETGYVSRATANSQGNYVLAGLRPGTYDLSVTTADGETGSTVITLGLGQVIVQDVEVGVDVYAGAEVDEIIVTGIRGQEVRTSEVGTNVTQTQINTLPQINRNFLNFAALAPGVRVTEGETERTISAGGQPAAAINVFIDGQNQKSTIVDGGVAGQDDSRGNPFPQGAVQEFRVLTQNFKAEYEQAGSAIITAVTRSGTNEFEGEIFGTYQNEDWVTQELFSRRRGEEKPKLERKQYGFTFGGPIIRDTLHFFTSYERKDETRQASVFVNNAAYAPMFASDIGVFETPFEQDLIFGKLSWAVDDRQLVELSATLRDEQDMRDIGGLNAASRAVILPSQTRSVVFKHQYSGDNFLNEFSVDYFSYNYNQQAVNQGDYGREYAIFRDNDPATPGFQFNIFNRQETVFITGGRADAQNIEQESLTFKNDLTFTNIEWMGEHTIKLGAKYSDQSYYVEKNFGRNPQFWFDIEGRPEINGDPDIPVRVTLASAVPPADVSNGVYGLYIQDDWRITDKLEINLGLRWDYEDNAVNNDYRTPDDIRDMIYAIQALPGYDYPSYFNPDDYITDGDREAFADAFQPRIGFSYDVFGDQQTVIFGGAGRYYDRIGFNFPFDERFKPTQFYKDIQFSADGLRPGTVMWDESYRTAAGLDPLLDAAPGAGEVFLIKNDAPPPRTDQMNFGVRQKFGDWQTSATLSYAKTENGFAWYIGNALTDTGGRFDGPSPIDVGYTQFRDLIFISNHDQEREYKALFLQADKPYNQEDGWGFGITYTLSEATQNGTRDTGLGNFDFDYNWPDQSPVYPSATDERHRIVANGILDLPMDFQLSGIVTLGSGLPFTIFACPDATAPDICWNGGRPDKKGFFLPDAFSFRQVDLRLTKDFDLWNGSELEVFLDAINVFNFDNFNSFEQCMCAGDEFGEPRATYLPTRSFQIGARYKF